jgi:hypothetical protein
MASPFPNPDPDWSMGMLIDIHRAVGENWGRVRVHGEITRSKPGAEEFRLHVSTAPVTLIFERDETGLGFQISRAEVGAFVPQSR